MADDRIIELSKTALEGDGCALKAALSKEDEKSHYELLGEIVKYTAEQRKEGKNMPPVQAMKISDSTSSDQFLTVGDDTIYRRPFGWSLGATFSRAIMGNVPECTTKKKQG
jgi:hypothetical protein